MAPRLPHALSRRAATTASNLTSSTGNRSRNSLLLPCVASSTASSTSTPTAAAARSFSSTPSRAADIIRRPRRPYQFTQMVQLSDGSTYTMRTCSPMGMYRSTKDTRNHIKWQPSDARLRNVEVDEAGKLAAFRERFGRDFDAAEKPPSSSSSSAVLPDEGATKQALKGDKAKVAKAQAKAAAQEEKENKARAFVADDGQGTLDLHDLISGYAIDEPHVNKQKTQVAPRNPKKK